MPNVPEPVMPTCGDCGNTAGPFQPEPTGARYPSGAQELICSDTDACSRRLIAAAVAEAEAVTPAVAYVDAPSIVSEIGWVARTARMLLKLPPGAETDPARAYYFLRKAALLDRVALEPHPPEGAVDAADRAARRVHRNAFPEAPAPAEECRVWVRCQYVQLSHDARHADGIPDSYAGQEAIPHE